MRSLPTCAKDPVGGGRPGRRPYVQLRITTASASAPTMIARSLRMRMRPRIGCEPTEVRLLLSGRLLRARACARDGLVRDTSARALEEQVFVRRAQQLGSSRAVLVVHEALEALEHDD